MRKPYHRPMKEGVVIGVLRYVRAEIIRDGLCGLEHADALLRARGVDPEALCVPRKMHKHFRRGALRIAILRALQGGPRTGPQIIAAVASEHGMAAKEAYKLVYRRLGDLHAQGVICAPRKDNRGRLMWEVCASQARDATQDRGLAHRRPI